LASVTVANGIKTHYKYTPEGLVSEISRTCPVKDVKDMVKVGKQPPKGSLGGEYLLSSIKVDYNADGLPMSISDNQGRVKTYDRDKMGRIIKELFPNKTSNAYKFTVTGQVAKVLDRRHNPIAFKWNKFGKIAQKKTAAGQFTDYVYDEYGLLQSIVSRFKKKASVDRKIKYTYNDLDRLTAVDYGKGQIKTLKYDSWGKLIKAVSTDDDTRRAVFNKYNEFDRVIKSIETVLNKGKAQSAIKRTYAYSPYGKRTRLTVTTYGLMGGKMVKQDVLKTKWEFNKFGQLVKIEKDKDIVEYLYNAKGRVLKRTSNGMEQYYTYTPLGQLETKSLGAPYDSKKKTAIATLKYVYATDSSIHSRIVNGAKQSYKYDQIRQLTAVVNAAGEKVEQYTYDPAGNILKKDVNGEITTFTYDKSNQLVSSTTNGKTTDYEYDAAGRMTKEGKKTYAYGWLDKVMSITQNKKITNSYSYSMNGQIASANISGEKENFLWDGLALIKRGTTEYVYEPAVTGGNPILANGKAMFNDILGNTLGVSEKDKFTSIKRNAFGKTLENKAGNQYNMFTGKPQIGGLGYAFLFRNYRSELGKWQTADPLGYPDGWNNLAYVNNWVIGCIDRFGTDVYNLVASSAVEDLGHSAAIIGNDSSGYRIVDFGGYSGTNELAATYSTLSAATAVLQNGRPAGENFDFVQVWNTTSVQDNTAYTVTQGYIANGYDSTQNNCSQVIARGLLAAGETASLNAIPNLAFTQNTSATTITITSISE
ncbi:MAG: RHS repeat protein, partial [Victivallaceae bacterium]|nr:RHS repeat protein [Victivallaceae bacterium]